MGDLRHLWASVVVLWAFCGHLWASVGVLWASVGDLWASVGVCEDDILSMGV